MLTVVEGDEGEQRGQVEKVCRTKKTKTVNKNGLFMNVPERVGDCSLFRLIVRLFFF